MAVRFCIMKHEPAVVSDEPHDIPNWW